MNVRQVLLALVASSMVVAGAVTAQSTATPPAQSPPKREGRPERGPGGGHAQRMEAIWAQLNLSAEQKAAIAKLEEAQKPAATGGERPTPEARQARRAAFEEGLAKILTPEQMTQFKQLSAKEAPGPGGRQGGRSGATPAAGAKTEGTATGTK